MRLILKILCIICLIYVVATPNVQAAQVTLAWDAVADQSVTGYKLYYGTASRNYTTSVDAKNVTTFLVSGLQDGTTYYFAATTYNSNRMESGFSNEVTYTTPPATDAPLRTCTYSLSSGSASFSASGGSGSVTVTAPGGCAWNASNAPSWITVSSGSTRTGTGALTYSVTANTGSNSRTAALTIAGQVYTVTQAGVATSFTITASATTGGSVTPSGTVSVAQGGTKSFSIQSNSGYYLSDVKVNGVSVGSTTSFTFTNVTANQTISATFSQSSYTLSVAKNGTGSGTVTTSPSASSYVSGTTVTLTAAPASGSQFTGWSGACSGTSPTCTVTMTSTKSVTASFSLRTYTLTASVATGGGFISPSGSVSVPSGSSQTFTISPVPGYAIANVRVDGVSVGPTTLFTFSRVTSGHTIEAFFTVR